MSKYLQPFVFLACGVLLGMSIQSTLYPAKQRGDLEEYLTLLESNPKSMQPMGDWKKGEIEIVRDPAKIREIEKSTGRVAGIIAKDTYWHWVNDPVIFPSGKTGIYGRMFWNSALKGESAGATVLPYDPERKVAYLIATFRHATRSWELELPQGLSEPGESTEETAIRETREETGLVVKNLELLGHMASNSGMLGGVSKIYLAEVEGVTGSSVEDSEAISGVLEIPLAELRSAMRKGEYLAEIQGEQRLIPVRQSYLAFALLQLELKG